MLLNQQRRRISLKEQYDIPEEGAAKKKEKKANSNTSNKFFCDHIQRFLHKTWNSEVSRYNNNGKEMYKKVCCTCKECFFFRQLHLLIFFFAVLVAVAV